MEELTLNGKTYIHVYISCPVCYERGNIHPATHWTHGRIVNGKECGGDIYLGEDAYYYCKKCGDKSHISKWGYRCPYHSNPNDNEYVTPSLTYIAKAVGIAAQLMQGDNAIDWLNTFLENLKKGN